METKMMCYFLGLFLTITPIFSQESIIIVGDETLTNYSHVNIYINSNYSSYQWYKNNVLINGANNYNYLVNEAGNYYVTYTDSVLKYSNSVNIVEADSNLISTNNNANISLNNEDIDIDIDSVYVDSTQNNPIPNTVEDYKGSDDCIHVKAMNCVTISIDTLSINTNNETSKFILIDIIGGTAPYTIVLNDGTLIKNYNTNERIKVTPKISTMYTVLNVTDANNCSFTNIVGNATIIVNNE